MTHNESPEFSEERWCALIESVSIGSDEMLHFALTDGTTYTIEL